LAERRYALHGEIDLASAPELESKLLVLVHVTDDDLILDCADLEFIDLPGIHVLIEIERLLAVYGRSLRMVNVSYEPRLLIEVLGLIDLLLDDRESIV
jgi:anti-anti-sigma factor